MSWTTPKFVNVGDEIRAKRRRLVVSRKRRGDQRIRRDVHYVSYDDGYEVSSASMKRSFEL